VAFIVGVQTHTWNDKANFSLVLFSDRTATGGTGVVSSHMSARCWASISSADASAATLGTGDDSLAAVDAGAVEDAQPLNSPISTGVPTATIPHEFSWPGH